MLIVGLTGGIGSGKTTVSNLFSALGVPIIDTDVISREIVAPHQPALEKIRHAFGDDVFTNAGDLDRRALRQIIFTQPEKRRKLEEILHPLIKNEVMRKIQHYEAEENSLYCIVVVPLLIESGWTDLVNRVLVVDVTEKTQIQRATPRDGVSSEQLSAILDNQAKRRTRLEVADDVIDNSGNLAELENQVNQLHLEYQALGSRWDIRK
jgi:dephospho-CoA kinase